MKSDENGFSKRLGEIQRRIEQAAQRGGRKPSDVCLIGASKTVSVEILRQARSAGLCRFGENRVQEALPKIEALGPGIEWHFIGHLQSNKVKNILGRFAVIHSLDRLGLAKELNRWCEKEGKKQTVFLEVNVSGEASKEGVLPSEVEGMVKSLKDYPMLELKGLMTIPPYSSDPESSRPFFKTLRDIQDKMTQVMGKPLPELSIGMSGDFEVAIEEGATYVRIGTALFGERPPVH